VEVAAVVLVVATLIAFAGIRQAVWVSVVMTIVETGGLAAVIAVGVPDLGSVSLAPEEAGFAGIASGAALVMFAFIGFQQIATLAEETERPERVIPLAMLTAIGITTTLYLLVAVSAVAVVGWERLAAAESPLSEVMQEALGGQAPDAIAVVALFSTGNTVLLMIVAGSRLIYGMASVEGLPRFLAWVHPGVNTPARAIVLALAVSLGFVMLEDISLVASATNFAVFIGFGAVCLSLLLLRRRDPDLPRPFRAPLNPFGVPLMPVAGLLLVAFLMVNLERDALLLGAALFLSGVVAMEALSFWRPMPARPEAEGPASTRPGSP
jgi:APA family basic amino acid/polyamine antiporter